MENEGNSFTISNQQLAFTPQKCVIKVMVKNTGLRSASFSLGYLDAKHFQILSNRQFSLAPGMSKNVQIKHVDNWLCEDSSRHKAICVVNSSLGGSETIACTCPHYSVEQQCRQVQFPEVIDLHEFDQQTSTAFTIRNRSQYNLRIILDSLQNYGISYSFVLESCILLAGQALEIQARVTADTCRDIDQNIQFTLCSENDDAMKRNYQIKFIGSCTNKSVIIRNENKQPISELKINCLNGASTNHHFFIDSSYHKQVKYTVSASVVADCPIEFAKKSQAYNVIFDENCGLLSANTSHRLSLKTESQLTDDDRNYTKKYTKMCISDENSALKLRNGIYAKKDIEFNIRIAYIINDKQQVINLPMRCCFINPSLRIQTLCIQENQMRTEIINDTEVNIPYHVNLHSLYRVDKQKGELKKREKTGLNLKWAKNNERCPISIQIAGIKLFVFNPEPLDSSSSFSIKRRPMTCEKLVCNLTRNRNSHVFPHRDFRQSLTNSFRPISAKSQIKYLKAPRMVEHVPDKTKDAYIPLQQLGCIQVHSRTITNHHSHLTAVIEIIAAGFIILNPGQTYNFDHHTKDQISYKIRGHQMIFTIQPNELLSPKHLKTFSNFKQLSTFSITNSHTKHTDDQQPYRFLNRQLFMSFKQSKEQFEVIDCFQIQNRSSQTLIVDCLTVNGEFFECKQDGNRLKINVNETGKFRMGFMLRNVVPINGGLVKPEKENRKMTAAGMIGSLSLNDCSLVEKQIKLLINGVIEVVKCKGQVVTKKCRVQPEMIDLSKCSYGSSQVSQKLTITSLRHQLNYMIDHPPEVDVKPVQGVVPCKGTINCTVSFQPTQKVSSYSKQIRIYIGGSHMEIIPLHIGVEDPQIYVKEDELKIEQYAIQGPTHQQLNTHITVVNGTPSQCFVQIDLYQIGLTLGYSKNRHLSPQMRSVQKKFMKHAKVVPVEPSKAQGAQHALLASKVIIEQRSEQIQQFIVTVMPDDCLKIPLTYRTQTQTQGRNIIPIQRPIAQLVGFGAIKSPSRISFNCKRTLLHIKPFKQWHEFVMTKNQQNYKIQLKNVANRAIKIHTHIYQQEVSNDVKTIVCTLKDIDRCLAPQEIIELNATFIVCERRAQMKPEIYKLKVYLTENMEQDYPSAAYFETSLKVRIAQPTLIINPKRVILPTVGISSQSQGSFTVANQGHKEIFIKINRPPNITLDIEFQIVDSSKSKKRKDMSQRNTHRSKGKQLNRLTITNSCLSVRLFARNKTALSFSLPLEVEDNFGNKQEVIVSGTFTDCPLFMPAHISNSVQSLNHSINSQKYESLKNLNEKLISSKNLQDSIDSKDILFLNNWFSSILPDFFGQGLSFEVWLTKKENLFTFFREFGVAVQSKQIHHRTASSLSASSHSALSITFQQLKKQGFQLNSLQIEELEKANQSEWLKFIWFFFSHQIISSQFEKWASKIMGQPISYKILFKSYPIHVPRLLKQRLGLSKESIQADWPQIIQRFEPLLDVFTNVESKRQLILSCNLLFHRLTNLKQEKVQVSGLKMDLLLQNKQMKELKYYLFCDVRYISCCQLTSEKGNINLTRQITANSFLGGYTFAVEQGETKEVRLSLKKVQLNKKKSNFDLVLCSNDMWDPITIYEVSFKAKISVKHNVTIQCQEKCKRDWVLQFQSRTSTEYQLTFDGHSSLQMASGNLGFLKKGQTAIIRVIYTPTCISMHKATLTISNNYTEQIYSIQGKPLPLSKVQFETCIRTIINQSTKHSFIVPWEIQPELFSLSSFNTNFLIDFVNEKRTDITQLKTELKAIQQQMHVQFTSQFLHFYRGLEILFNIHNMDYTQSKIIKVVFHVAPKPIFIKAEIEAEINQSIVQNITVHNLYKIGENVQIRFQQIESEAEAINLPSAQKQLSKDIRCPFEVIGIKNNEILSFVRNVGEILDELQIQLKFQPKLYNYSAKLMYCLSFVYAESLAKVVYIFNGKIKESAPKQILEQEKDIHCQCIPLKKYQKSMKIYNSKPIPITYEVSTEMNEISGKPTITVEPSSFAEYHYQILCLHFGDKKGCLLFRGEYKEQKIEIKYNLHLKLSDCSACENGIKIYRQKCTVQSRIRKPKTLSILLNNLSDNNLEYQIICDSPYLQTAPTIQLKQNSETTLDIEYLPLFVGEQTALLTLFNPHQPEITYFITMISHQHIQQITQEMPGIGETKPIKITFNNPSKVPAKITLESVTHNNCIIQKWCEHIKFFTDNHEHLLNPCFTIQPHQTINLQLHFSSIKLQQSYKYSLIFTSDQLSKYKFNILYRYIAQKLMQPIFMHSSSIGSISFLNRFENAQKFHCKFNSKSISLLGIRNIKNCNNMQFELEGFTTALIEFQVLDRGEQIKICIQSSDNKFMWVYPITVYELCISDAQTVVIKGQANERIYVKVLPLCITSLSNVQLVTEGNEKVPISLTVMHDSIRLRKNINGQADYHKILDESKVYEVELEVLSATPCKSSGFLYLYSSKTKAAVSASIISDSHKQIQSNLPQKLIAQKIPYELTVSQPKIRTIQISSNMGLKSVVKIKIQNIVLNQSKVRQKAQNKHRNILLELLNNKNKQFEAQIDDNCQYLQITYHPKQYSGLKKARLTLTIDDCQYRFLLLGTYLKR